MSSSTIAAKASQAWASVVVGAAKTHRREPWRLVGGGTSLALSAGRWVVWYRQVLLDICLDEAYHSCAKREGHVIGPDGIVAGRRGQ